MFGLFGAILGWLSKGPLDRILSTIDRKMDAGTERERIKSDAVVSYVQSQASIANSRQWWFPIFFLAPAGMHFAAVCLYSILFCRSCAAPQDWSIAALPPPFDYWEGVIVTSLFVGKAGEALIAKLRK